MNKQFVTYEIALKLKELGFNEECFGFYKTSLNESTPELIIIKCNYNSGKYITIPEEFHVDAPLWQQAIDWVREKHRIEVEISYFNGYRYTIFNSGDLNSCISDIGIKSFEKARERAILKAIELIK